MQITLWMNNFEWWSVRKTVGDNNSKEHICDWQTNYIQTYKYFKQILDISALFTSFIFISGGYMVNDARSYILIIDDIFGKNIN